MLIRANFTTPANWTTLRSVAQNDPPENPNPPEQPTPPEPPPQEPPAPPAPPTPPPACPPVSRMPDFARGAVTALPRVALSGMDGTIAWFAASSPAAAAAVSIWGVCRIAAGVTLAGATDGTRFDTPKKLYKGVADAVAGMGLVAAANGAGPVGIAMAIGGNVAATLFAFQEGALPPKAG